VPARKLLVWPRMSDESPPLRIKPRLKSESSPDAPAADAAPAAPDNAAAVPRITLRPKLSVPVPAPAAPAAAASGSAPPAVERPRLKPKLSVESPAPPPAESSGHSPSGSSVDSSPVPSIEHSTPPAAAASPPDVPKFKLKPKGTEPVPATLPVVSLAPPPEVPGADSAAEPVAAEETGTVAPPVSAPAAGEAPPVPKLKINFPVRPPEAGAVPGAQGAIPRPPVPKIKGRRPSKLILISGIAAGVLVLAGAAYLFWPEPPPPPPPPLVIRPKPKPPVAADQAAKPAAGVEGGPASMAGKMVDKAQTTVAAREAGIDASSGLLEKRPSGTPTATDAAGNAVKGAAPGDDNMDKTKASIAPGIMATTSDVVATTEASPAFRMWAANVKIGGVFPGRTPPRAFINSRAVDAGQIVDDALAIVFDSVDDDKKIIIFKDKSGAKVVRKY
jgi:hypothetical protein